MTNFNVNYKVNC